LLKKGESESVARKKGIVALKFNARMVNKGWNFPSWATEKTGIFWGGLFI